jgi:predicted RNA binding protein YcfA (HicA-like mRNA interferase family)
MPIKVRDVIKDLENAGWRNIRTKGDHQVFRNAAGQITVVSGHLGDDVRPGA